MNWTRVHVRTFYSRVLQCKLNRTELVYKRTLPLFLYMWQIKTSDDELDKSVCAGGWATDLSCSNEQKAELNPSLSDQPSVQICVTPPFHKFVAQKRDDSSSLAIQQQRTEAKRVEVEYEVPELKNVWWRLSVHPMLSSDDSKLTLLWSPPEEATRITFLHYIPHKATILMPLSTLFRFETLFSQFSELHQLSSGSQPLTQLSYGLKPVSLFARFRLVTSLSTLLACFLVCNLASLQTPHVMTNPSCKNKRVIATCQKLIHGCTIIIHISQIVFMSWLVMTNNHLE